MGSGPLKGAMHHFGLLEDRSGTLSPPLGSSKHIALNKYAKIFPVYSSKPAASCQARRQINAQQQEILWPIDDATTPYAND